MVQAFIMRFGGKGNRLFLFMVTLEIVDTAINNSRFSPSAKELKTFSINPFGKVWLSNYHKEINKDAYFFDIDTYLEVAVRPDNIISLTEPAKYRKKTITIN